MINIDKNAIHWLPRLALVAFVVGIVVICIAFTHVDGASPWFRWGAGSWLLAYFLVIFDNFKRRLPVQTRGGVVRREDGAVKYALPFVPLFIMGLIALVVLIA